MDHFAVEDTDVKAQLDTSVMTQIDGSRLNYTQGSKMILAIGRKTQFDHRSAALFGKGTSSPIDDRC